jgi:hypothetical protein
MFKMFLGVKRLVLIAGVCIFACVVSGCLESSFRIASESRLPKWVTLPAGVERADVSLTVSYYTTLRGDSVQFMLQDKNKQTIQKMSGKDRCLKPFQLTNSPGRLPSGYPNYAVVTVDGITEILEQRRPEDVLYVTDDPIVWKQYRTVGCG